MVKNNLKQSFTYKNKAKINHKLKIIDLPYLYQVALWNTHILSHGYAEQTVLGSLISIYNLKYFWSGQSPSEERM